MRIGIEVQRLFRKKKFGIESAALQLIRALKEMHPQHEYVIFAKADEDLACLRASENVRIRTVSGMFFADFEQFHLPIATGREKIDLLHCTGNTTPYFCPVPVVQTLHDVIFMDSIPCTDTFYQRFGNYYRRMVVPLVTARSHAVITVSEYEKHRIVERLGIDPERIHVIYNGLDETRFHPSYGMPEKRDACEKYGIPERFVLFLGNQAFRKNPERAVEAYVHYASMTTDPPALVTPGLSKEFIRQRLGSLKYRYDAKQFITPGYISGEDLPALYAACEVFLFPSISEGFGMPIAEAMACGAPVITSSISCMPEVAGNAALLTNPLDARDIAAALKRLLGDESLRLELREAGFRNAKRFSWRKTAEEVSHLYETVILKKTSSQKVPGFFDKYVFATRHE